MDQKNGSRKRSEEIVISNEMPPEPEEPLPSDCCGLGCSPCVFDIYERDLEIWRNECRNLVGRKESTTLQKETDVTSLSCAQYRLFELLSTTKINNDTRIYRFKLPKQMSLALQVGQHLLLRLIEHFFYQLLNTSGSFENFAIAYHNISCSIKNYLCFFRSKLNGKSFTRAYTPISPLNQEGHFDVMIKVKKDTAFGVAIRCSLLPIVFITALPIFHKLHLKHKNGAEPTILCNASHTDCCNQCSSV